MIEVHHFRYVVAAAERGSFRRAATALDIEESAISRRIRDLEDELGAALFIRHHAGVELTQAGQRFLYRARRALNEVERAVVEAGSFGRGEAGIVRIGIFTSLASGFPADLLRAYVGAYPVVRPDLVEGGPGAHIAAIQRLHLDIAFLTGQPIADGCDVAHLWNLGWVSAAASHHREGLSPIPGRIENSRPALRPQAGRSPRLSQRLVD